MHRHREHIHRLHPLQPVARTAQHLQISGEGGRIAGDIDDPPRLHLRHSGKERFITPLPRRINHDHVCPFFRMGPVPVWQYLLCPSLKKFHIGDMVYGRIFPGVFYSRRNNLYSVYLTRFSGQKQGDRANPAVEIPHSLPAGKTCKLQSFLVKLLCLLRVHLIERLGGNPVSQAADCVGNAGCAGQENNLISQDHIGFPAVYIEGDGCHPTDSHQAIRQDLAVGKASSIDHQAYQDFSRVISRADQHMAYQTLVAHLVVRRNFVFFHKSTDGFQNPAAYLRTQKTFFYLDDGMGASRIKTVNDLAFLPPPKGELSFVPISESPVSLRIHVHADDGLHGKRRLIKTADPYQMVPHLVLFKRKLPPIGHGLQLAAAAGRRSRTEGLHPKG